jgi:hypothetical protein
MYARILAANTSPGQKADAFRGIERLALPGSWELVYALLGSKYDPANATATPESSALQETMAQFPALAIAAGRAYVATAGKLDKDRAIPILRSALENARQNEVASLAAENLAQNGVDPQSVAQAKGFLTKWQIIGPFPNDGDGAFKKSFFPEGDTPMPDSVAFEGTVINRQDAETQGFPAVINFRDYYRESNNKAAYAYAEFNWSQEQPVHFLVGSDDGCELWVNGQKVHENPVHRTLAVDADKVPATLRPGVNRVLIKVLNGAASWEFCVRLADANGAPLDLTAAR